MINAIDNHDNDAQAQFDEATRRLEAAGARVRALSKDPLAAETARQTAADAFEEARLIWTSSEAVLRSAAIVDPPQVHAGKTVMILQGNAHVGESIALLLRLRGFRTTVLQKHRVSEKITHAPATAVVIDIDRNPDYARELAVSALKTYPGARIIGMIPAALESDDWKGFDAILVKPASIDMLVRTITGDTVNDNRR